MNNAGRFTKRPITIEAVQYTRRFSWPDWFHDAVTRNDIIVFGTGKWAGPTEPCYCEIKTLEGTMRADENDWVIRGIKGEIYPCKPGIFEASYIAELEARTPAATDLPQEFAADLYAAVAQGWCEPLNTHKIMDHDLAEAIVRNVQKALDNRTHAAPVVAEGLHFATFEDWLASPINPNYGGNSLHETMINYARLAFNAARAAHPVAPAVVAEGLDDAIAKLRQIEDGVLTHDEEKRAAGDVADFLAAHPVAGSPAEADFDEWMKNPYTKVLQDSIKNDYVPRAAEPVPASEAAYGYAMMRDGVMQGHAGNKAIARSWVNATAIPLAPAVPASEAASDWTVGSLLTMSDSDYPGMGSMFGQIWQGYDLIARVYGDSADEVRERTARIAAPAAPTHTADEAAKLADDLAWHKESLARHAAKLDAVWKDLAGMVEKFTGKPCSSEPLSDLTAILAAPMPASEAASVPCNPVWERDVGNAGEILRVCATCGAFKGGMCRINTNLAAPTAPTDANCQWPMCQSKEVQEREASEVHAQLYGPTTAQSVRDALEQAAGIAITLTKVPGDLMGQPNDAMVRVATAGERIATAIRALIQSPQPGES